MEDWVVLSDSDGDSVELHDGSDVGGSDSESGFAVVRGRAAAAVGADTPAALPHTTIAVEAVPLQPSPSPPGFFKTTVSYRQAFSGKLPSSSQLLLTLRCSTQPKRTRRTLPEVSPAIAGGEHENAEISDVAERNNDHVDSNIAAAEDTTFSGEEDLDDETNDDIECFDEEDGICENPDDEIFDDEEELDDDDESLDDDDIECYDVEDKICEENPDDEIFDDEEEIDCEEDLDDDDDDCESLDDDNIECFDAEDIICLETRTMKSSTNIAM
uniref:Uncharacterized protein n=1 Tax=Oryza rufipogon TaxID=4529 RepID=A0A0E0P252_ORYRU